MQALPEIATAEQQRTGSGFNAYGEQGSKSQGAVVTLFVTASNRHDA